MDDSNWVDTECPVWALIVEEIANVLLVIFVCFRQIAKKIAQINCADKRRFGEIKRVCQEGLLQAGGRNDWFSKDRSEQRAQHFIG